MNDVGEFADKTTLITGGGSGLGENLAFEYAALGGTAFVADIDEDALQSVVERAKKKGYDIRPIKLDVASEDSWDIVIEEISAHGRLDSIVNNAGLLIRSSLEEMNAEEIEKIFNVNVKGVFFGMQKAAPFLEHAKDNGRIVNVASTGGIIASGGGYSIYSASKSAVIQISKCAAIEFERQQIRVNCVCPSAIPTAMTEAALDQEQKRHRDDSTLVDRASTIDDVSNCILFLLTNRAAFINGTSITIDGGATVASR